MPLYLTSSHSSRVRKPAAKTPALRRSTTSPFCNLPRRKPNHRTKSADDRNDDSAEERNEKLDDTGTVISLAAISPVQGVIATIKHSHANMFTDIPERAGMNSTRIAELLNYRKRLPQIVSLAHVHGLISASTRTERQIADLIASGDIRKLTVSGRGNEISGLREFLILSSDLEICIRNSLLDPSVADKFIELLHQQPHWAAVSVQVLSPSEITACRDAGLLVSSAISRKSSGKIASGLRLGPATISRQASGSIAAAGGEAAFDSLGGIGNARTGGSQAMTLNSATELRLSVPNMGAYLRLVNDARIHLLELLGKSKCKQAPLYLTRERWDGAVESGSSVSQAKRSRGEFAGILPGKTKKFRQLYGLNFDWIVEECLGAGLVELFDTSSVGHGIRVV